MEEVLNIKDAAELLVTLAKKKGADACESKSAQSNSLSVTSRMEKIEKVENSISCSLDLRFIKEGRQVVLSSSDFARTSLAKMVDRAAEMVKYIPVNPYCRIVAEGIKPDGFEDSLERFDKTELSLPEMEERAIAEESSALSCKGITNSEGADFYTGKTSVVSVTDKGFYSFRRYSETGYSISVIAEDKNGNKERDYAYDEKVFVADLKKRGEVGKEAASRTLKKCGAVKIASGVMPLVFEPRTARSFMGILASAVNGESITKNLSFLQKKLGKQVFKDNITIIDNPLLKRSTSSRLYDAEGFLCKCRNMVENGVLQGWFLSLETAEQLGLDVTASAVRGLGSIPQPSASNLYLDKGEQTQAELIKSVKKGLFITEAFGQGINLTTGDYSRAASGFLIENGEITTPVHEITIAGNLTDMFMNLTPADDLKFETGIDSPSILIEGMSVSGS